MLSDDDDRPPLDNVVVTDVFRPLSTKFWFALDALANKVVRQKGASENSVLVDGMAAEMSETVRTADGEVMWRVSSTAQSAENTAQLEEGLLNKDTCVSLGTYKVNLVTMKCTPSRVLTRSIIDVIPVPVVLISAAESDAAEKKLNKKTATAKESTPGRPKKSAAVASSTSNVGHPSSRPGPKSVKLAAAQQERLIV